DHCPPTPLPAPYTLSLHDALPISPGVAAKRRLARSTGGAPRSSGTHSSGGDVRQGIDRRGTRIIGKLELRRGAPQALEVVIPARLLAEHVHDEISEVKKHPFGGAKAFAVAGRAADARKLFF